MSTGPEHYRQAETCLQAMTSEMDAEIVGLLLKEAHVHAMLAVAAATVESSDPLAPGNHHFDWWTVLGEGGAT